MCATTQIQNRYNHGGQVDEPLSFEAFASDGSLDQSYTYHADHLGSIRFVTDSVGTIVNAYEYDSYGRPGFELEHVTQPFRYTGREWDQATELYNYRARQYDPEAGRFLQEDPIGFAAGDLNIYRYVESNPLNYTYPSGLSAISKAGGWSQAAAGSAQIGNVGIALNCLFASIAASIETETDLVNGREGGVTRCGNELVGSAVGVPGASTIGNAGATARNAFILNQLEDNKRFPILQSVMFRFVMIGANTARFITEICNTSGECERIERIYNSGA